MDDVVWKMEFLKLYPFKIAADRYTVLIKLFFG